jgi:hypothetical protein
MRGATKVTGAGGTDAPERYTQRPELRVRGRARHTRRLIGREVG